MPGGLPPSSANAHEPVAWEPLRLPPPPAPRLVTRAAELEALLPRWLGCAAIGLDTEFVRTRTFYAKLGLVQIADPEGVFLVDVLAIPDLQPIEQLLRAPQVTKVFHSSSEDLEVLFHGFGGFPQPLFDTQVAASLVGLGSSPGYQRMVQALFGLEIPKGETRSNWLERPLRSAQVEYASLDVAYLLPAHEHLVADLRRLGRSDWAEEEFSRLLTSATARLEMEWGFERIKKGSLTPRQRAILRSLADWRETAARERDRPRHFVLPDEVLIALARSRPRTLEALRGIEGLSAAERKRSGTELLRRISAGLASRPEPADRIERGGRSRGTVDALKAMVVERAAALGVPTELLAQRRLLEELVQAERGGAADPLPAELRGWRRQQIGERLVHALRAQKG